MKNEKLHVSQLKEIDLINKVKELVQTNSYKQIIEICKDSPFLSKRIELTQFCAQSYEKLKNYPKAIEVIENYFENRINPRESEREYECLINLSKYYLHINKFDKANEAIRKAKIILNSSDFKGNTNFEYDRIKVELTIIENTKNMYIKNKATEIVSIIRNK